jgi:hypothetical protein
VSYLHCPACSRAYNIAAQAACPYCPVQATPVDPREDIIAAAESLVRAMSRANDTERAAALATIGPMLAPVAPSPSPPAPPRPMLVERLARRARRITDRVIAHLENRPPPKLLADGLRRARAWLA